MWYKEASRIKRNVYFLDLVDLYTPMYLLGFTCTKLGQLGQLGALGQLISH